MNKVILIGRLTADPEIRYTQDGKAVASFSLAVNRDKENADFIRCCAWERRAKFAEEYLKKGTKVALTGRIRTGSYKNQDGKTVYTTDVIADDLEFCESKQAAQQADGGFAPIPDEDIKNLPFN